MKSLYNKYFGYTDDAAEISAATKEAIAPIMAEWATKGYNPREIAAIMHDVVWSEETFRITRINLVELQEKRERLLAARGDQD